MSKEEIWSLFDEWNPNR